MISSSMPTNGHIHSVISDTSDSSQNNQVDNQADNSQLDSQITIATNTSFSLSGLDALDGMPNANEAFDGPSLSDIHSEHLPNGHA